MRPIHRVRRSHSRLPTASRIPSLHKRKTMTYAPPISSGRIFPSAIHSAVLILFVLVLAHASAQAQSYEAGGCYDIDSSTLQWRAVEKWRAQNRPWLFLSERVEGQPGYFVHVEGGRCLGRIGHHFARIVDTCRHPVSDRTHTLIYTQSGAYLGYIEIWSADSASGNPVRDYVEVWGDLALQGAEMEELVAADGSCMWQERKKGRQLFDEAMSDLRVGGEIDNPHRLSELPTRIVPAATVEKWLRALDGIARLEGAVYASDADREAWRVVQVHGVWNCDAGGVVLLLDRKTGDWRAIYDVPSGCTKVLSFSLRDMVVRHDRLFAWACTACSGWGFYEEFAVNLRTHRVAPVRTDEVLRSGAEGGNPPIVNIGHELFSHGQVGVTP